MLSSQEAGTTEVSCCGNPREEPPSFPNRHVNELPTSSTEPGGVITPSKQGYAGARSPNLWADQVCLFKVHILWHHLGRLKWAPEKGYPPWKLPHTTNQDAFLFPEKGLLHYQQTTVCSGEMRPNHPADENQGSTCLPLSFSERTGTAPVSRAGTRPAGYAQWYWQKFCSDLDENRDQGTVIFHCK